MKKLIYTILTIILSLSCETKKQQRQLEYIFLEKGEASWYGPGFNGNKTANGEKYDMNDFTAAHRTLAFGTLIRVTTLKAGKRIVIRINDRGPVSKSRILDLSKSAAKALGIDKKGSGEVKIEIIKFNPENE